MRLYPEPNQHIVLGDGSLFDDGSCFPQTEDPKQLPLPSPFLFQTHYRLVNALHHFRLEKSIAQGWPPEQSSCEIQPSLVRPCAN
jgi:hypothetical protein